MELELARLLNCNDQDKKQLADLWDEYLLKSDDEDLDDKASDVGDALDCVSSDDDDFNMKSNRY